MTTKAADTVTAAASEATAAAATPFLAQASAELLLRVIIHACLHIGYAVPCTEAGVCRQILQVPLDLQCVQGCCSHAWHVCALVVGGLEHYIGW